MTEKRNRPHSFHLRLSDEEYEKLQREAKMAGLKPQTYIHKVLKGHQITERAPMDLIETVRKLNRIGINLILCPRTQRNDRQLGIDLL